MLAMKTNTLLLLSLPLLSIVVVAQQQSIEGWNDDYKLDYSYDVTGDKGPDRWGDLTASSSSSSAAAWGEWDVVRQTAGENDNNEDLVEITTDNQCGREQRPSPIELIPSATCTDTQELMVREYNPSSDCRHPVDDNNDNEETGPWEVTPYSLRYYMPRTDRACRPPTVRLDGIYADVDRKNVEEHFVLLWLEVHARSEHVIHGKRYDAEIQMVHRSTTRPNELVVVSVLLDASHSGTTEDHADFQRYLLDGWQRKHQQEVETCDRRRRLERNQRHLRGDLRQTPGYVAALQDYVQDARAHNVTQYYHDSDTKSASRHLQKCTADAYGNGCSEMGMGPRRRTFPYNLWPSAWYFSYEGSLTAPPCAGRVHWRIMDTPLYVHWLLKVVCLFVCVLYCPAWYCALSGCYVFIMAGCKQHWLTTAFFFFLHSAISRRQYKQLTYLLTQSRDERCQLDTATSLQGENFRPLQNAALSSSAGQPPGAVAEDRQGGNNNNNREEDAAADGPQVVSHCTRDNFFVTLYDADGQ